MKRQWKITSLAAAVSIACAMIAVSAEAAMPKVVAGNAVTVALKTDGTVWVWGGDSHGTLGNGTFGSSIVPLQVAGLTDVVDIDAAAGSGGAAFVLAAKADGTVWTWGTNGARELGRATPQAIQAIPGQVPNFNLLY